MTLTEAQPCTRCGRVLPDDAPRGLCPACLLEVALAESHETNAFEAGTIGDPGATADAMEGRADPSRDSIGGEADPAAIREFGDYELHAVLGRGGMGVVYRARQVSLNRPVALKMIRAGVLAGDDELRRFRNEAEAVARLDHPSIVPVYEVGEHDGQHYFSMKLVPGGNLADHLPAFCGDPRAAALLLVEAAEAVHHAHARGILHRDLKPANILVDDSGHPHITDFGLAKRVEADAEMTISGAILGTPAYMAPEQALGRRGSITTATDVYGLGSVLYSLLTGRPPFVGDSVIDTLAKVREETPEPPRKFNAKVPRDLEVICLKCLEKDPRRRYSSAQALADDVRAWLENRPIAARPVGSIERMALFMRRRPALAAAYGLTAAVVLLLGFGGSLAWLWRAAEGARAEAVVARNGEARARASAERSRDGETKARTSAENSRDREVQARAEAEKSRDGEAEARAEADRQREKFERSDYGRTIHIAQQKLEENNVAGAVALLDSTRPDFRGWEWRYLDRLCHPELLNLKGHGDRVWSAAFSPDGARIVTASDDQTAKVWDAKTGVELLTIKGHTGPLTAASFSPDGLRIMTASLDRSAKIWNAKSGSPILAFGGYGYTNLVYSATFSPDGSRIVTASSLNSGTVWDAKAGAEILGLKGASPLIKTASSPDGSRIVTTSYERTAKLWDANTGVALVTI
jgi:hypothetical protein